MKNQKRQLDSSDKVNRDKRGVSRSKNGIYFNFYTSPLEMLIPRKISPKDPEPIFLINLYLPPTINSDFPMVASTDVILPGAFFVLCLPRTKHCPFKIRTTRTKSRRKFYYREHPLRCFSFCFYQGQDMH